MAIFELVKTSLLEIEGGYVNDPDDPGGETNFGISKRSYPYLDIKNLTFEEACEIYKTDFWFFYSIDKFKNQLIANKIFLCVINTSAKTVFKCLQKAICRCIDAKIVIDGVNGTLTINATNELIDQKILLTWFKLELLESYLELIEHEVKDIKYLDSWVHRVITNHVENNC